MDDYFGLDGKVAVVTGAASGMGRAIAQALAGRGVQLVLADYDAAGLERAAGELGASARSVRADVTVQDEIKALFAFADQAYDRLDILVTAADIITTPRLLETSWEDWDRVFAVNAKGTFFCVQEAVRRMLPRGQGRIVTIGSRAVVPPGPGFIAYTTAKAAVIAFTQALAQEVKSHGITVNSVLPSTMDTEANRRAMPTASREDWVTPESVARAILFLASDAARDVTGTLLAV